MVQAVINFGEHENRVVQVVKGKYGFKNKSQAINQIVKEYEDVFLGKEVRPEYLKKLQKIAKGPHIRVKAEELQEFFDNL